MTAWTGRRTDADHLPPSTRTRILHRDAGHCHVCGHPGATQVDHVTPWAEWTRADLSPHDDTNLAAIHGTPCPTCGLDCHSDKTKAEAARGRARSNERRKAQARRPSEKHPGSLT